jgi:hypothetical protein
MLKERMCVPELLVKLNYELRCHLCKSTVQYGQVTVRRYVGLNTGPLHESIKLQQAVGTGLVADMFSKL